MNAAHPAGARPAARGRQSLAALLVAVGAALLLVGLPLAHTHRTIEPARFADHAGALLEQQAVRDRLTSELTTTITNNVVASTGAPAGRIRLVVEPLVRRVVASPQFAAVWKHSIRTTLRKILDPHRRTITVTVADLAELTEQVTGPLPAAIAAPLRRAGTIDVATFDRSRAQAETIDRAEKASALGVPALVAGLAAFLVALAIAGNRRRILIGIGAGVAVVALIVLATDLIARSLVTDGVADPSNRKITADVWDELLGGLRTTALVGAAAGIAVAGIATAVRRPR